MPQAATIKSLPRAFQMMKARQPQGIEGGEDYRGAPAGAPTVPHERRDEIFGISRSHTRDSLVSRDLGADAQWP